MPCLAIKAQQLMYHRTTVKFYAIYIYIGLYVTCKPLLCNISKHEIHSTMHVRVCKMWKVFVM